MPVIPYRSNAKDKPKFFLKTLYVARARVEILIGKVKRFKRFAMPGFAVTGHTPWNL
ncbi:MAG: hypothetical protein ACJ8AI_08345 [Rhodopila sp.]